MSEEKQPPDMDEALQSLLGDIAQEPQAKEPLHDSFVIEDPSLPPELAATAFDISPEVGAVQNADTPAPDQIPTGEITPAETTPPIRPAPVPPASAVNEVKGPREKFRSIPPPRRKRKWPFVLLGILLIAGGGFYSAKRSGILHKAHTEPVELPPEFALPPMDAEFLPDTSKAEVPEHAADTAHVKPPEHAKVETHTAEPVHASTKEQHEAEKPLEHSQPAKPLQIPVKIAPCGPRAMDSATIHEVTGRLKDDRVQFRCSLVLFSSESGLRSKVPPFEEAIRVVASNIFYFTVPGKAIIPDIEQQVLQKAGFLFPEGKLIRVEVRNLELEPVKNDFHKATAQSIRVTPRSQSQDPPPHR